MGKRCTTANPAGAVPPPRERSADEEIDLGLIISVEFVAEGEGREDFLLLEIIFGGRRERADVRELEPDKIPADRPAATAGFKRGGESRIQVFQNVLERHFDGRFFTADADIARAVAQAKAEKKPLLLYWGAKWCPPCNQLKATLFNRADLNQEEIHILRGVAKAMSAKRAQ